MVRRWVLALGAMVMLHSLTAGGAAPEWDMLELDSDRLPFAPAVASAERDDGALRRALGGGVTRDVEGGSRALEDEVVLARLADPETVFKARVKGGMTFGVECALRPAFREAQRRITEMPECRALFTALGRDALVTIRQAFFVPASRCQERRICEERGALAFTTGRSPLICVCKRFSRVSTERATLAVIHESLHLAGLGEWPRDPDGPTSAQIDHMVAVNCGRGISATW